MKTITATEVLENGGKEVKIKDLDEITLFLMNSSPIKMDNPDKILSITPAIDLLDKIDLTKKDRETLNTIGSYIGIKHEI